MADTRPPIAFPKGKGWSTPEHDEEEDRWSVSFEVETYDVGIWCACNGMGTECWVDLEASVTGQPDNAATLTALRWALDWVEKGAK